MAIIMLQELNVVETYIIATVKGILTITRLPLRAKLPSHHLDLPGSSTPETH